jgi:hypothetical protein
MNAGVPWTAFSWVSTGLAVAAQEDVGWLDVAVHQAAGLGLRQRVTHLAQQVDRPFGRGRPEVPEQRVGIEPVEQLHHIVEGAVGGDAEIEQLHRVG